MPAPTPPKNWLRLFRWFCDPNLHPFVEGDLHELHRERVEELGRKKADRRFAIDVLLLFRPGIIKPIPFIDYLINHLDMFKSYFKIGFRNLSKHRFFTLINFLGMTIGMCCVALIALYIQYETSYDRQHQRAGQVYRVAQQQLGNVFPGGGDCYPVASLPLVPTLKEEFSEIQTGTTFTLQQTRLSNEDGVYYEQGLYADPYLFEVFSYPVVEGIAAAGLQDPNSVILTESMAEKYFGNKSAIGKNLVLEIEEGQPLSLTVRGVIEDLPTNQHFSFDFITSVKNIPWYKEDLGQWANNNYRAYIVLPEDYNYTRLEEQLGLLDKYLDPVYAGTNLTQPTFFLQPLTDIHLHSQLNFELSNNGDIRYIYFSAAIAFIILLLGAINYMNLTTARASQRAKEVGMRKVMGATKGQLVSQFMAESLLITLSSFVVGIGLAYLLLPAFNSLLDQEIPYTLSTNWLLLSAILLTALVLGSLSGLYPALLTSVVSPVKAFKGYFFKSRPDGAFIRKSMVVGQFTAAIVLAICSVVIYQQLRFIQNKKIGFNREQVVFVPYQNQDIYAKATTLREELLKHPQIEQMTVTNSLPLNLTSQGQASRWEGNSGEETLPIFRLRVDHDFIDMLEIEVLEGRGFSTQFPSDSIGSYLLNEAAVQALGWESAVGKVFEEGKVIGVVKDFHFQPFSAAIEPLFITFYDPDISFYGGAVAVKIGNEDPEVTVGYIRDVFRQVLPDLPFDYGYMDETYRRLYESEQRFGQVFNIFTAIALFIACMGLLGLVTHHVIQRTKEIGIRKVLGASLSGIVQLIAGDFLKLVFIAALLAIPLAWWGMHHWLQDFTYRIDLNWWLFVVVSLLTIGLAFLTVSTQAVRAATANPVDSLKIE